MRIILTLLTCCLLAGCSQQTTHPEEAALKEFLTRYFSTWSANDMEGYGACFHPLARISYVNASGRVDSQGTTDFLHGQKMSHQMTAKPMKEVPLEMQVSGDKRVAHAAVKWHLMKEDGDETGMDYFTLVHADGRWQILALAFFMDPKEEQK